MRSTKPYLLRAMHEWMVDGDLTPHLIARGDVSGLQVPPSAIQEGQVILNIAPQAVRDLLIDNEGVSFVARFGGVSQSVYLPIAAVEGIYAKENGRGMLFGDEISEESTEGDSADHAKGSKAGPKLRVIK